MGQAERLDVGRSRLVSSDADEESPTITTFLPLNGSTLASRISTVESIALHGHVIHTTGTVGNA
jgi:hypothetical protein